MKAIAINGSPQLDKGNTAMILMAFSQGLAEAGAQLEILYASRLKIKPCSCGSMRCWYDTPGACSIQDDMQSLYPRLKAADTLILATPVYIPLPGALQNFINRLCPLIHPYLEFREGRTRAGFLPDVQIRRIVLVATGGWWEIENLDTVVRIAQELAEDASVEFSGALLRPHAFLMRQNGNLTPAGQVVQEAARQAGVELAGEGRFHADTLQAISNPLVSEAELRELYNSWLQ